MTRNNLLLMFFLPLSLSLVNGQNREYYELRTYHCSSAQQIERLDTYFESVFLPLSKEVAGIGKIGVFYDLTNDTAEIKRVFVLISATELTDLVDLIEAQVSDEQMDSKAIAYLSSSHEDPPYERIESSWLWAFKGHPVLKLPELEGPIENRVFELRSYEAATESLYRKKVHMFNEGGEIDLFESLDFNAIFYAETLSGPRMPNLVYMTSFENMSSRDEHWDEFRTDERWEKMKKLPMYQNTVSSSDIYLCQAATYSQIK